MHILDIKICFAVIPSVLGTRHKEAFGDGVQLELNDFLSLCHEQEGNDQSDTSLIMSSMSERSGVLSNSPKLPVLELKEKPIVVSFLSSNQAEVKKQLEPFHVELKLDIKTGAIKLNSTKYTPSCWQGECKSQIQAFLKAHCEVLENIMVPKEGLQFLITEVSSMQSENPSNFAFNIKEGSLSVAGLPTSVSCIQDIIKEISDQYTQTKQTIHLEKKDFIFFTSVKLPVIGNTFPSVNITSDSENHTLLVCGSVKHVNEFQSKVKELCVHRDVHVQIDQEILPYLQNNGKPKLLGVLNGACPLATYFKNGNMFLLCNESETKSAEKVAQDIQKKTSISRIDFGESFQSLSSELEDFFPFCRDLEFQKAVEIKIDVSFLTVIGFQQSVGQCAKHLQSYMEEKCTIQLSIDIEWGIWRLFKDHMMAQWSLIVDKCNHQNIHLQEPSDKNHSILSLKGDRLLAEGLAQEIQALQRTVRHKTLERDHPGTSDFFQTDKARIYLNGIEKNKVTIEVKEDEDEDEKEQPTSPTNKLERKCTAHLEGKTKRITVYVGDITEFDKADVIVNAANEELKHIGGVAKAISDKGGPIIQNDSTDHVKRAGKVDTGGVWLSEKVGKLPCKALVHAVGPNWSGGTKKEAAQLKKACFQSLLKAGGKYQSISFPAISSGVFGFPIDKCAESMINAFVDYNHKYPNANMKDIFIVLWKESDVRPFITALQNALSPSRVQIDQTYVSVTSHPQPPSVIFNPELKSVDNPRKRRTAKASIGPSTADHVKLHKGSLLDIKVRNDKMFRVHLQHFVHSCNLKSGN